MGGARMEQIEQSIESFFAESKRDTERAIKNLVKNKKILTQLEGGKRLRPMISLLSFKACTAGKETAEEYQRAVDGTVSIELAHTSSLIHDDIIDNDVERRGRPALYIEEGIGAALLLGHKMLALGCDIALDHGVEFAQLYIDTWNQALSGELLEVHLNRKDLAKLKSSSDLFSLYLSIIDLKTASLFASACRAGALEAHAESEIADVLTEYGREVGRAYQLADDLVDFENGELLDSVILPILSKVEKDSGLLDEVEKRTIRREIVKHEESIKQFYIREIKNRLQKAEALIRDSTLPDSIYKEML
ncbi:MAG TPA: polyprenyl synthetase family protein, partial [Thermoplasmatales archaeon]|nr:polyprenyl synthetase family protein [Thermoplasmatales archaeon]